MIKINVHQILAFVAMGTNPMDVEWWGDMEGPLKGQYGERSGEGARRQATTHRLSLRLQWASSEVRAGCWGGEGVGHGEDLLHLGEHHLLLLPHPLTLTSLLPALESY